MPARAAKFPAQAAHKLPPARPTHARARKPTTRMGKGGAGKGLPPWLIATVISLCRTQQHLTSTHVFVVKGCQALTDKYKELGEGNEHTEQQTVCTPMNIQRTQYIVLSS